MKIWLLDSDLESLKMLEMRMLEAIKQASIRRAEVVCLEPSSLEFQVSELPDIVFIGPSCLENVNDMIAKIKLKYPRAQIGLVLQNDVYAIEAVKLKKALAVNVMAIADLASMSGFLLDQQLGNNKGESGTDGIIAVSHLKGGVGASTITASMAACYAEHDLSTVIVDLDDINPQLSDWARIPPGRRATVGELLRQGEVPSYRLSECLSKIDLEVGSLSILGQPENYHESFHFKADVLEGAPSSQVFIESLLPMLKDTFDVVIIDLGRSWGVSHFATLPLCQSVVLVVDEDAMTLRRTIDSLRRLERESDKTDELDFSRWKVVLNGYTGKLLQPEDVSDEFDDSGLFPEIVSLHTIPFSEKGRAWGAPFVTFYDLAEEYIRGNIATLCQEIMPFKRGYLAPENNGLMGKFKGILGLH